MTDLALELCANLSKWCQTHIEPFMEHDDEEGSFRMEIFRGLGSQGFTGITLLPFMADKAPSMFHPGTPKALNLPMFAML
jgi:hypothetical protein